MITPSDPGVDAITARIDAGDADHDQPGGRHRLAWVVGIAAAVVLGLVAGGLYLGRDTGPDQVATGPSPSASASATSSPSPSAEPTASPSPSASTAPAGELDAVPVYWVGDSRANSWLYREFRTVPDVGGVVASAVSAAMSGAPLDPDYRTSWSPPSRLEVTQDGDAIIVDVSADAFENTQVGSQQALLAVQQVVWTATAAAGSSGPVTILVDGAGFDAWGAIRLGDPMQRDAGVQAQIWIDSPNEGAQVPAGPVTVTGVSTAFEATIDWELTTGDGAVVASDFAMGGANGTFDTYEFSTPDLAPGTYTISIWAPDMSDGESPEGERMFEQDRTFTVG